MSALADGSNSAVASFSCFVASVDATEALMLAAVLLFVMLAAVVGVLIFAWGYRCGEEHRITKPISVSQDAAAFFMPTPAPAAELLPTDEEDEAPAEAPKPTRIPLRI